jgi:hypothetical protein
MKRIILLVLVVGIAGCKSNPYEGKPNVAPQVVQAVPTPTPVPTATPEPTATPTPTATPVPTPTPTPKPVFSLEAPGVMRFKAGIQSSYIVRGSVPAPGVAQITFTGLPAGMTYNRGEEKLYWNPAESEVGKTFVIEVRLKSSIDANTALVKESVAVVESAFAPAIALAQAKGDDSAVQMQFTALGQDTPNWTIQGAKPGEVQFVTVKFKPSPSEEIFGSLLSLNWNIDFRYWTESSRALRLIACNADGTACSGQEIKLNYDPYKGMTLIHPETAIPVGIGR